MATAMAVSMAACCGSASSSASGAATGDSASATGNGSYDQVTYAYATFNNIPTEEDLDVVAEGINKIRGGGTLKALFHQFHSYPFFRKGRDGSILVESPTAFCYHGIVATFTSVFLRRGIPALYQRCEHRVQMQHREVPRAVHRLKNLFPLFLVEFVIPARSDQKFWFSMSSFYPLH